MVGLFRLVATGALVSCLLPAQQSRIAGPVAGYVFDGSSHAVRPVLGLPGSSLWGAPLDFGFAAKAAYVAPRQDAAIAVADDGSMHWFRIDGGQATEREMDGRIPFPQQVVFSPSGTAVAIFARGSIEVIKNLPDNPGVAGGIDLPPGTKFDSMAVSDDGKVLLVSADSQVRFYGSFADMGKLLDTGGTALTAFAAGGHDGAAADPASGRVVLFRDLTGASASQILTSPDESATGFSALAFSGDGQRLLVANATAQSVTAFDLAAGNRSAIACTCAPNLLARMGDVFRLNDLGGDPVWLLDLKAKEPRVVFIPALSE